MERNLADKLMKTERSNGRTEVPNGPTEVSNQDDYIERGVKTGVQNTKRLTERYSFEIYSDQVLRLVDIVYLYRKKMGEKLPISSIIRKALDEYLDKFQGELDKP